MKHPITPNIREEQSSAAFVTVLAWILIVLSGTMTVMTTIPNVVLLFVPQLDNSPSGSSTEAPVFVRFMLAHPQLWFFSWFLVSASTLVVSVGLLKRRRWARLGLVALLSAGVGWIVFAGFVVLQMWHADQPPFASDGSLILNSIRFVIPVLVITFAAAASALLVWLVKRMLSPSVRGEFERHRLAA